MLFINVQQRWQRGTNDLLYGPYCPVKSASNGWGAGVRSRQSTEEVEALFFFFAIAAVLQLDVRSDV